MSSQKTDAIKHRNVEDTSYTARSCRSDAPSTVNSIQDFDGKINPSEQKMQNKNRKGECRKSGLLPMPQVLHQ